MYGGKVKMETLKECIENKTHLKNVDKDGYCNVCGFQEVNERQFYN